MDVSTSDITSCEKFDVLCRVAVAVDSLHKDLRCITGAVHRLEDELSLKNSLLERQNKVIDHLRDGQVQEGVSKLRQDLVNENRRREELIVTLQNQAEAQSSRLATVERDVKRLDDEAASLTRKRSALLRILTSMPKQVASHAASSLNTLMESVVRFDSLQSDADECAEAHAQSNAAHAAALARIVPNPPRLDPATVAAAPIENAAAVASAATAVANDLHAAGPTPFGLPVEELNQLEQAASAKAAELARLRERFENLRRDMRALIAHSAEDLAMLKNLVEVDDPTMRPTSSAARSALRASAGSASPLRGGHSKAAQHQQRVESPSRSGQSRPDIRDRPDFRVRGSEGSLLRGGTFFASPGGVGGAQF